MKDISTKLGWELIIPINLIFGYFFIESILDKNLTSILINLVMLVFVNIVFFGIKYSINHNQLLIKNSIFGTKKIDIQEIKKIEKTSNLISSPAPSIFGRVEIYYKNDSIVISPKNFDEFKNELLKINPNIIVKE